MMSPDGEHFEMRYELAEGDTPPSRVWIWFYKWYAIVRFAYLVLTTKMEVENE